ncbi:MAG: rod shape-determining protein MreD [Thermoanaerobaculia bacterium]
MRSVLRFALGVCLALVLALAGTRLFPDLPRFVDFFLVVAVANALGTGPLLGMLGGLVAGLVADGVSGGPLGLFGLAGTLVGYGAAYVAQRLVIQRTLSALALFVAAAVGQQAILLAVVALLLPRPQGPDWLGVLVKAGSTGVLGTLLFAGQHAARRRYERWQQGRPGRLRLGR